MVLLALDVPILNFGDGYRHLKGIHCSIGLKKM
jgi:hypothetical protein